MAKKYKEEDEDESTLLDDTEDDTHTKKRKRRKKEDSNDTEEEDTEERPSKKFCKEDFDFKIKHTHDGKFAKLLRSRGVSPLDILHGTKSFNLEDVVQPINAQSFGKVKKINAQKQLTWYEKSYAKVLGQSWLSAGIGGFPSDARAKQIALHMFIRAIEEYQARDPRKNQNRSLPLWHHVYGGFGDSLRDMKSDYPAFVVISNITPECTNLKFEKVRDCLCKFNNMEIPVLVVCGGMDPYTLFSNKLYYPMRWCVSVGHQLIQM
jgi:hypothetical protein